MEPTNHPFRKENDLSNLHDYVPAINLPGCKLSKKQTALLLPLPAGKQRPFPPWQLKATCPSGPMPPDVFETASRPRSTTTGPMTDPIKLIYLDVSENNGTPKSSILIGFSIIFTIHLGALFLETPIYLLHEWLICIQEISNGRTHWIRTWKNPEYLIARSQLTKQGPLVRSHSIFDRLYGKCM